MLNGTVVIKRIAPDKWKHFFVGIVMGGVLQAISAYILPNHMLLATIIVFVIVVLISYGFEVLSLITGRGHYEVMDAVAAIIGSGIGMAAALIMYS